MKVYLGIVFILHLILQILGKLAFCIRNNIKVIKRGWYHCLAWKNYSNRLSQILWLDFTQFLQCTQWQLLQACLFSEPIILRKITFSSLALVLRTFWDLRSVKESQAKVSQPWVSTGITWGAFEIIHHGYPPLPSTHACNQWCLKIQFEKPLINLLWMFCIWLHCETSLTEVIFRFVKDTHT